ncbi:Geranylgeranylglyceryl phosphate synthase [archaeon HR06]|nr:Geranylgeranylglyceryl phosphate synthase [archaeon HR06]
MGPVEKRIHNELKKWGKICFALIDSENFTPERAAEIAKKAEECNVSGILVGGSTALDQLHLKEVVDSIKKVVTLPVILFPNNVTGICPTADAIFFMSLLNSENPYYITEAQALGALVIWKYNIETLPVGYLVIGDGGTIGFIGKARGIPPNKPSLAVMYSLAAYYLGMRYVYLEAGSGVTSHVSSSIIKEVKKYYKGTLIVGGGIRSKEDAYDVASSGADIIVIGNLLETKSFEGILKEIVETIRSIKSQ